VAKKRANPTVGQAIGHRLRELREANGLTHDQLAFRLLMNAGLAWTPDVLSAIEAGRRHGVDLGEFLMLVRALGQRPEVFFAGSGVVQVGPRTGFDRGLIRSLLRGRALEGGTHIDLRPSSVASDFSEAEQHAAAKLSVEPGTVRRVALQIWRGRRLHEERDRRLARNVRGEPNRLEPGERTARRGRITRELLLELQAALEGKR
jgi:transcriptional regulator with XRE-family HTH domain